MKKITEEHRTFLNESTHRVIKNLPIDEYKKRLQEKFNVTSDDAFEILREYCSEVTAETLSGLGIN